MSASVTPAKRPHDQSFSEAAGRRKWQKSGPDNTPFAGYSSNKVIRLLFPASKAGGLIGKGGSNLAQIRQETGAKVYVEETFPGCDERVVVIINPNKDGEPVNEENTAEANKINSPGSGEKPEEHVESVEKQAITDDNSQSQRENETQSIQKALLVVFEKMADGLSETNEGDEEGNKMPSSVVRLLVFSGQVGCLLGKAGSVIKQTSSESGAQIRILPKDKLPTCASSSDELVQISGKPEVIRKALQSVSQQLLENHSRNYDSFSANPVGVPTHSIGLPLRQDRFPPSNLPFHGSGAPYSSGFHDGGANLPSRGNFHPEVLTYRLLCSEEKVGGVIGKQGSIVKGLQHETGCEIKVLDGEGTTDDRIIIISGLCYPEDGISAPQDAVLRVQARIFRSAPESKDNLMVAKLLVSSNQIGCLLGKGGSVIAEMRKSTGAYIRILGKDQVPESVGENEEVVQVNGEFEVVQEALLQITSKLRNHAFRDTFPPSGHPPNPGFMEPMPPFPPYMGRREFSPSGTFSNRGPSFNNFNGPGGPPPGSGFHPRDGHPPFPRDFPGAGYPPHIPERMGPGAPWPPQVPMEGVGPMPFPDYRGAPPRRPSGFPGATQQAIITSTTVEVVVPCYVVPAIYGEDGGCLRHIREFSDAKITISDPKPGSTESVIIISGTPEQTNAAQSLIQAFVIKGSNH